MGCPFETNLQIQEPVAAKEDFRMQVNMQRNMIQKRCKEAE
jgi:hypothetical protein